jgi:hypothetical protein
MTSPSSPWLSAFVVCATLSASDVLEDALAPAHATVDNDSPARQNPARFILIARPSLSHDQSHGHLEHISYIKIKSKIKN